MHVCFGVVFEPPVVTSGSETAEGGVPADRSKGNLRPLGGVEDPEASARLNSESGTTESGQLT